MSSQEIERRVLRILDEVIELSPGKRRRFLDQNCGGDSLVRRRVESLLVAEDSKLLAQPAGLGLIGPYQLICLLGRGGMGEVYKAERKDLGKLVALKLVRRGLDNDEIVRRFNSERKILANLDHPYIARLFDGGTTEDGRPYLVMEYVEGKFLDKYCDHEKLSIRRRLELFVKICSAVELSHQKLVVHRDLKPGNILVTPRGVPKLLDFGIAKLLQPSLAAEDPVTSVGHQPMTLGYASPEQAGGERVATTSDIYSLGVLLYELLSGHAPYRLDHLGGREAVRVIREQEPEKPSVAVGRVEEIRHADGTRVRKTPKSVSRTRDSDPRKLRRRLAGDLDSIVWKALRKEPRERYGSVQQLAEDVRRHLQGLPVTVRPDSFTYTAGKFIRRNKLALAVTAGFVLLSLGFGVLSTVLWRQAVGERQRAVDESRRAVDESRRARMTLTFLEDMIKAAEPDQARGETMTVVELLEIGRQRIPQDLTGEPRLQIDVADTLGVVFRQLGEYGKAKELMELALEHYPEDHLLVARRRGNLAVLHYDTGEYSAAEGLFRQALATGRGIGEDESLLLKIKGNLASSLMLQGKFEEAEVLYRQALAARLWRYGPDTPEVATSKGSLGILYHAQGELEKVEPLLREALAIRQRVYGDEDTRLAPYLDVLGRVRFAMGRRKAAAALYGEAKELYDEAEVLFDRALAIRQRRLPEDHPHLAQTRKNLAALLTFKEKTSRDPATAQVLLTLALETFYRTDLGGWQVADAESILGAHLTGLGRYEEAEPCLIESYEVLLKIRGERAIYTRSALSRLLVLYQAWGQPDKLAEYLNRSTRRP